MNNANNANNALVVDGLGQTDLWIDKFSYQLIGVVGVTMFNNNKTEPVR